MSHATPPTPAAPNRSVLRKILNRLYPFPLLVRQGEQIAQLEAIVDDLAKRSGWAPAVEQLRVDLLKQLDAARWNTLDRLGAGQRPPERITCRICGHAGAPEGFATRTSSCIFGGGKLVRYVCPACDTIFGPLKVLLLPPEELAFEYKLLYAYHHEADSMHNEVCTFELLQPRPGGCYLNYGAGAWCQTNTLLRQRGCHVYGYEPFSQEAGEFMITRPEDLAARRFDGIFSNNVIEHFADPVQALRSMAGLLRDGNSLMAHSSPCFDYVYEFTRFHLHFYPGRSVGTLAQRAGLRHAGETRTPVADGVTIAHVFART